MSSFGWAKRALRALICWAGSGSEEPEPSEGVGHTGSSVDELNSAELVDVAPAHTDLILDDGRVVLGSLSVAEYVAGIERAGVEIDSWARPSLMSAKLLLKPITIELFSITGEQLGFEEPCKLHELLKRAEARHGLYLCRVEVVLVLAQDPNHSAWQDFSIEATDHGGGSMHYFMVDYGHPVLRVGRSGLSGTIKPTTRLLLTDFHPIRGYTPRTAGTGGWTFVN